MNTDRRVWIAFISNMQLFILQGQMMEGVQEWLDVEIENRKKEGSLKNNLIWEMNHSSSVACINTF